MYLLVLIITFFFFFFFFFTVEIIANFEYINGEIHSLIYFLLIPYSEILLAMIFANNF